MENPERKAAHMNAPAPQLRTAQLGDALTMLLHMLTVVQGGGKISPEDESCLDDLIVEIRRSRL
jgi:hypothetical protein